MEWPDGTQVVVEGFFTDDSPPDLQTADGARLSGDLAADLSGFEAPAQYAQAAPSIEAQPIGTVESLDGSVTVIHADGTQSELKVGAPVFQGDELVTGDGASVGIVLADDTVFSMGENGALVLDEMVYDPATQEGSVSMSVMEGVFTFVSGQIAKTDPDAMTVNTPVATIGIRGTQVGLDLREGQPMSVVLMEERDGLVGEVVVTNDGGVQILNTAHQGTTVSTFADAPTAAFHVPKQALFQQFGATLKSLPTHTNPTANDYTDELAAAERLGGKELAEEELAEFETAAGEEEPTEGEIFGDIGISMGDEGGIDPSIGINPIVDPIVGPSRGGGDSGGDGNDPDPSPQPIVNTPPVIGGATSGGVIEDVTSGASGTLTITDADDGEASFRAQTGSSGSYGTFSIDADGEWSYGLDNTASAVQALAAGKTLTETFTVRSVDGTTQDVTVTITGTNDAPVIGGATSGDVTEDVTLNASGTLTITDPDADESGFLAQTDTSGSHGSFSVDATGPWTYKLDNADTTVQALAVGETLTETFTVRSVDGTTQDVTVTITGTNDEPEVSGQISLSTRGGVDLTITTAALLANATDIDGDDLSVSGLSVDPANAGTLIDNSDGTWTFTPESGWTGTVTLNYKVSDGLEEVDASGTVSVGVLFAGADELTGSEDTEITFTASDLLGNDYDPDPGNSLSITSFEQPADGTVEYDSVGDIYTFTPDEHWSGETSFTYTVSGGTSTGGEATGTVTLTVEGVADDPLLGVPSGAQGEEGETIDLNITAYLTDTDGSETLSVLISGVPDGATLSAGTDNDDGTWTLEQGDLANLTITIPEAQPVTTELGGISFNTTAEQIAAWEQTVDGHQISVSAFKKDGTDGIVKATADGIGGQQGGDGINGFPNDASETIEIDFGGMVVNSAEVGVRELQGTEQGHWEAWLNGVKVGEGDFFSTGNASQSVAINVVNGFDTLKFTAVGKDSSYLLEDMDIKTPGDPVADFELTVEATATENGTTATATAILSVTVTPITTAPITAPVDPTDGTPVIVASDVTGDEDTSIALGIQADVGDSDGGAVTLDYVIVSNLPDGAVLSVGTRNANGTWTLTPEQLPHLAVIPAEDYSGEFNLRVTAVATDGSEASEIMSVTVEGVADTPTLEVSDVTGGEDTPIALDITAALGDTSETLSISIIDVPDDAILSAGTKDPDTGIWTLVPADLDGLTVTPPADSSENFKVTVIATATDDGDTSEISATILVTVEGVADEPELQVGESSGTMGSEIPLDISAMLTDTSETLSVLISGVPDGVTLSPGAADLGNGRWSVDPGALENLSISIPEAPPETVELGGTGFNTTTEQIAAWEQTVDGHQISVSALKHNDVDGTIVAVEDGIGVLQGGSDDDGINGFNNSSETIEIDFDGMVVNSAEVGVQGLFVNPGKSSNTDPTAEQGHWVALRDGEVVGEGDFFADPDAVDGRQKVEIEIEGEGGFDTLQFTAVGKDSDYLLEYMDIKTPGDPVADFELTVEATATENGTTATATAILSVDVDNGTGEVTLTGDSDTVIADPVAGQQIIESVMMNNSVEVNGLLLNADDLVYQEDPSGPQVNVIGTNPPENGSDDTHANGDEAGAGYTTTATDEHGNSVPTDDPNVI